MIVKQPSHGVSCFIISFLFSSFAFAFASPATCSGCTNRYVQLIRVGRKEKRERERVWEKKLQLHYMVG